SASSLAPRGYLGWLVILCARRATEWPMDNHPTGIADEAEPAAAEREVPPPGLSATAAIAAAAEEALAAHDNYDTGGGAERAAAAAANVNLDFNVDSLNLDSFGGLAGLDFDVSSLLKQSPQPVAQAPGARPSPTAAPPTPAVRPKQQPHAAPESPEAPEAGDGPGAAMSDPAAGDAGEPAVAGEERYLTESVVVTSPGLVPPPHGFGPLYDLESTFRSLCHGISPANAEWSSLNILAVTWPQLEAAPAANRRLAQRDISDVSSMSVADSVRLFEERRPPSSAIHLFRLHVHPPPVWGADTNIAPIQPSLLPLCELRMQQQWDEQVSRANMDRLVDAFSIDQTDQQQQQQQQHTGNPHWQSAGDSAGRFEIFRVGSELNSWHSVYHIDFDHPVVACLWLANARKYGISRRAASPAASTQFASLSTHQVMIPTQGAAEGTVGSGAAGAAGGAAAGSPSPQETSSWDVDPSITIRRLPFFGPRNTQGEYALVVATADGQLVLVYQRDEKWARVVAPLRPGLSEPHGPSPSTGENGAVAADPEPARGAEADSPWSNIPSGHITHADMMLVSKKWIYLSVHRAGASPTKYPHEPGALPDGLKRGGTITAPMVEVYRIQVEFASDYSPRLFATPLVVQPITLPAGVAGGASQAATPGPPHLEDLAHVPRVTHLKLITALNPEVRPVEKNVLGENHYFPLLFVSLGTLAAADTPSATHASATTLIQVWRLESAPHAQKSVNDLLRRPPPLRLTHMWTERRQGLLLSVIANRAERQQLRYLFAKPSDKDYRALMLTWADGRVEMLRNYQDHEPSAQSADCFDQCVHPVRSPAEWVIGSILSPHYTAYFQLVMRPRSVELGKKPSEEGTMDVDPAPAGADAHAHAHAHGIRVRPDAAVACTWNQSHARFRLGWTPLLSDLAGERQQQPPGSLQPDGAELAAGAMNAHVQAYCGDLLAVRILNKEDPTDLVALLANVATFEESQSIPARKPGPGLAGVPGARAPDSPDALTAGHADSDGVLSAPVSRTLQQALFRACTLLARALKIQCLDLDPLSSATPYVRRLLGAIMQAQFLAQHNIQATSLGLLLHVASVVEARVGIVHEHVLQSMTASQSSFDITSRFSDDWRRLFPSAAALVLWCIDLLVALTRDTYLYLNVRCADRQGFMKPLCELDDAVDGVADHEAASLRSFRGEQAGGSCGLGGSCLLPGRVPSRLALLFHRSTLDAVRSLLTFVTQLEADILQRIHILNSLPPNAASIPEYADMVKSRDMLLSTAQQLAHALEYLPVGMQRLKNFLADVQDLYAADDECMSVSSQAMLLATSAVVGPFRKYLPRVARSFARHVLEPDATLSSMSRPAVPGALVLHDTRWVGVVACQANVPGLPDGTTVFETPWRVALPVAVADSRLIEADEDTLVPATELAEWEREKSEFERALDEDNVLFDIDDPGFIFFDTSDSPGDAPAQPHGALAAASHAGLGSMFADFASGMAMSAPVKITTKVPDFSDVLRPDAAARHAAISDADADYMFSAPLLFDTAFGPTAQAALGAMDGAAAGAPRHLSCAHPGSASQDLCATPPASASGGSSFLVTSSTGSSTGPVGRAPAARGRHAGVQHFVPHYSSTTAQSPGGGGGELGTGWQFVSMSQYPKLHIPTLLAQHACSLAVLSQKRSSQQPGADGPSNANGDGASASGDVAYCIDWSRSEGIVVESTLASGLSGIAAAAVAAAAAATAAEAPAENRNGGACYPGGQGRPTGPSMACSVGRVDVIQKTMLPADAPVKMCLRCGHLTRRALVSTSPSSRAVASADGHGEGWGGGSAFGVCSPSLAHSNAAQPGDIGWIRRFSVLCVCGGSWIAL
ncbi:hypothetical protein LPJ61_000605, partial [Coemansia biformis]